jgi:hypothetical protein
MENNLKDLWPKKDTLAAKGEFNKLPYIVLSEVAESVGAAYENAITGMVTASFFEHSQSKKKSNFSYSLYLIPSNQNAQMKLLAVDVKDDGWYPVKVHDHSNGYVEDAVEANSEKELIGILSTILSKDSTKALLNDMLNAK